MIQGCHLQIDDSITTISSMCIFVPQGSSPALISDVALAVASKLTTAVLSKLTAARLLLIIITLTYVTYPRGGGYFLEFLGDICYLVP